MKVVVVDVEPARDEDVGNDVEDDVHLIVKTMMTRFVVVVDWDGLDWNKWKEFVMDVVVIVMVIRVVNVPWNEIIGVVC